MSHFLTAKCDDHGDGRPSAATGSDHVASLTPRPTSLSGFTSERRLPTRPPHARDADFAAQFDDDTLFFDAFRSPDGRHVVLLGPPFFNLDAAFRSLAVRVAGGGQRLRVARVRRLDRHAQIWVRAPADVTALEVSCPLGQFVVSVGDNLSALFAGRRVLLTKSRDNPLPWITDWIRFNRDVNGADAVLFYDNGSTLTSLAELRAAIGGVAGIARAAVVDWRFKFGPQGPNAHAFWDSDFCELGAWEHARWRFLSGARSVMAGDVDEFPLGRTGVFQAAEDSRFGVARYHGRWIVRCAGDEPGGRDPPDRRHRDFTTVLRREAGRGRFGQAIDLARCAPKWTVVPSRCPGYAQWHVHTIRRWAPAYLTRSDLGFAHFRPISTSWKYGREDGTAFDPARHERHEALSTAMARVAWDR